MKRGEILVGLVVLGTMVGWVTGSSAKVDVNAGFPGDLFGSRLILEGPLSIRRIGL